MSFIVYFIWNWRTTFNIKLISFEVCRSLIKLCLHLPQKDCLGFFSLSNKSGDFFFSVLRVCYDICYDCVLQSVQSLLSVVYQVVTKILAVSWSKKNNHKTLGCSPLKLFRIRIETYSKKIFTTHQSCQTAFAGPIRVCCSYRHKYNHENHKRLCSHKDTAHLFGRTKWKGFWKWTCLGTTLSIWCSLKDRLVSSVCYTLQTAGGSNAPSTASRTNTTKKIWSCEHFRMVTGDILLQMLHLVVVIQINMIVEVVGNVSLTVFGLNSTLHWPFVCKRDRKVATMLLASVLAARTFFKA